MKKFSLLFRPEITQSTKEVKFKKATEQCWGLCKNLDKTWQKSAAPESIHCGFNALTLHPHPSQSEFPVTLCGGLNLVLNLIMCKLFYQKNLISQLCVLPCTCIFSIVEFCAFWMNIQHEIFYWVYITTVKYPYLNSITADSCCTETGFNSDTMECYLQLLTTANLQNCFWSQIKNK